MLYYLKGDFKMLKKWIIKKLFKKDVIEIQRLLNQIEGMREVAKANLNKNLNGYLLALEEIEIVIKDLR